MPENTSIYDFWRDTVTVQPRSPGVYLVIDQKYWGTAKATAALNPDKVRALITALEPFAAPEAETAQTRFGRRTTDRWYAPSPMGRRVSDCARGGSKALLCDGCTPEQCARPLLDMRCPEGPRRNHA